MPTARCRRVILCQGTLSAFCSCRTGRPHQGATNCQCWHQIAVLSETLCATNGARCLLVPADARYGSFISNEQRSSTASRRQRTCSDLQPFAFLWPIIQHRVGFSDFLRGTLRARASQTVTLLCSAACFSRQDLCAARCFGKAPLVGRWAENGLV